MAHSGVLLIFWIFWIRFTFGLINENRLIENDLLKIYDRKHRPVKQESTTINIQVYLMINHIEKVDEHEQTMLLHGIIWSTWYDEYLKWAPGKYNNTYTISMETYKIWQPTFALYNSARSNAWFVHMNGLPATISSSGRVFAAGTFTFYVTCQFDFSNYPYDVQECPMVLAEWMYDLSKVNLSESVSNSNMKPSVRLSFDPISESPKKHVAGWELIDTWQKHCYWGPNGCVEDVDTILMKDNYWSLLEFGVRIKRHAPYYLLTMVFPILITTMLTLVIYWITDLTTAVGVSVLNILYQGLVGLALLYQLPPGNGRTPKIALMYTLIMCIGCLTFTVHVCLHWFSSTWKKQMEILWLKNLIHKLKTYRFFQIQGLSFDPESLNLITAESVNAETNAKPLTETPRISALSFDNFTDFPNPEQETQNPDRSFDTIDLNQQKTKSETIVEMEPINEQKTQDFNDQPSTSKFGNLFTDFIPKKNSSDSNPETVNEIQNEPNEEATQEIKETNLLNPEPKNPILEEQLRFIRRLIFGIIVAIFSLSYPIFLW